MPGLPDMSRCRNNVCNKNQKLKSNHNAVPRCCTGETRRERERERAVCEGLQGRLQFQQPGLGLVHPARPPLHIPGQLHRPSHDRHTHNSPARVGPRLACLSRPGPGQQMSAHWRQVLPPARMASTAIADATGPSAVKTRPAMISDFKSSVHILNPLHMYNVHAVTVQAFQEIKTFTVQAFQEIKSLKRFRGATRNGEYYHDMMACDGSSKPDSEFVQVQVARCNKISSLESPKIFSCGLRLYRPWKTLSGC